MGAQPPTGSAGVPPAPSARPVILSLPQDLPQALSHQDRRRGFQPRNKPRRGVCPQSERRRPACPFSVTHHAEFISASSPSGFAAISPAPSAQPVMLSSSQHLPPWYLSHPACSVTPVILSLSQDLPRLHNFFIASEGACPEFISGKQSRHLHQ
jgi:hypothetical protein